MRHNPQVHHRHSIRLPGHDYAQAGAYFVTIVTQGRDCMFGQVVDDRMELNRFGQFASREWQRLVRRFGNVSVDAFVIMPNHVHGIIILNDTPRRNLAGHASDHGHSKLFRAGPDGRLSARRAPTDDPDRGGAAGQAPDHGDAMPCQTTGDDPPRPGCAPTADDVPWGRVAPGSIPAIVRAYKSAVTLRINLLRGTPGGVWQRNYYDHIIRADAELQRARQYILNNPLQWALDRENPHRSGGY